MSEMNRRLWMQLLIVLLVVGVGGRLWLIHAGMKYGYNYDLPANVSMGLTAADHGLFNVYSVQREDITSVDARRFDHRAGMWQEYEYKQPYLPNLPPVTMAVLWASASVVRAVDSEPVVNTFGTRLIMLIPVMLVELLLVWGVYRIGRHIAGVRGGAVAAAVTWLLPPIVMDLGLWAQIDAWVMAPMVFGVYLMLRNRWLAAGAVCGLAVLVKPQGLLLGPVALLGAWLIERDGGRVALADYAKRVGLSLGGGLATMAVVSLPWMAADGMAWIDRTYITSFDLFPRTTLSALNFWYLSAVGEAAERNYATHMDVAVTFAGLSRDDWGKVLTFGVMFVLAGLIAWRVRGRGDARLMLFSGLWLWAVFLFPTRVHERYIVYCMPFVILAALSWRAMWPAVAALVILGSAEMTTHLWLRPSPDTFSRAARSIVAQVEAMPAGDPQRPTRAQLDRYLEQQWQGFNAQRVSRPWEVLLCVIALGGFVYATAAPLIGQRREGGDVNP